MPIQEQLQEVPRTVVRVWLRGARLPLRALEAVVHRGEHDTEWPPILAFDAFESQVKQVAGSVLRDEELAREGRLIQAKVEQLRKAATLETIAERREATAAAKFEARREAAEQRRERIERDATQRAEAAARATDEKKQRIERKAADERRRLEEAEAAERRAVEREERAAAKTRVDAEREALEKERAAVAAKGKTVKKDAELRATKAARR